MLKERGIISFIFHVRMVKFFHNTFKSVQNDS